jgi:uridine kinase
VYSFADYARTSETKRIEPHEFLIVEGLFVLYWPELRAMLDTRVYVETDPAVCFDRRLRRDIAERGRTPESVREQYERTVRPSAEQFVIPTRSYAGLVVSGEEPLTASTDAVIRALSATKAASV